MHADGDSLGVSYILRFKSILFGIIPKARLLNEDDLRLLDLAHLGEDRGKKVFYPEAVEALWRINRLEKGDVDTAYMLLTCAATDQTIWTRHVSGIIPPEGTSSGFLRALTYFNL